MARIYDFRKYRDRKGRRRATGARRRSSGGGISGLVVLLIGGLIVFTVVRHEKVISVLKEITGGNFSLTETVVAAANGGEVSGRAVVVDGDTIEVRGRRIRLHGIDAPELDQKCQGRDGRWLKCGRKARFFLANMLRGRTVTCEGVDTDRYGRMVAICRVGGEDMGRRMVSSGWAVAYRRYSWRYVKDEWAARMGKRGLWSGRFVDPETWRHTRVRSR